jgi:hypothetical protein
MEEDGTQKMGKFFKCTKEIKDAGATKKEWCPVNN